MPDLLDSIKAPGAHEANIVDRLRYLVTLSRKTQAQFSRLVGVDPSNLSRMLSGRAPVNRAFINRVVADLGVSKEWFVNGTGVPFPKHGEVAVLETGEVSITNAPKGAPVYDVDATCGIAPLSRCFTEDNIVGYLDMPGLDPRNPIVRVSGDSMDPRVPDGALISIRAINDPSIILWGNIYLVQLEDYRMVKYIRRHHDPAKIILHSENPAYDDVEVERRNIVKLFLVENVINCTSLA